MLFTDKIIYYSRHLESILPEIQVTVISILTTVFFSIFYPYEESGKPAPAS